MIVKKENECIIPSKAVLKDIVYICCVIYANDL